MNIIREKGRKLSKWLCQYINGTRGVISLFLAILMVPFVTIAGALVNAGRINSAVAIFDEALSNASNSTLGTYDEFLRSRFGLLAISQNYPDMHVGYTAEEFIQETFVKYMEQNCGVLSNTFISTTYSASGVYPLADTDILLSQVNESGKYSIPMKMVIDGFSLDDILKKLLENFNFIADIEKLLSDLVGGQTANEEMKEALEDLAEKLDDFKILYSEYETAFSEFKKSVNDYNALIDERQRAINQCQAAINTAKSNKANCETAYNEVLKEYSGVISQLIALENATDSQGNKLDKTKEINQLKKDYKDELEEFETARTNLENAKNAVTAAETNLENTKVRYDQLFAAQRTTISEKKSAYIEKIEKVQKELLTVRDKISSAQSKTGSAVRKAESTVTDFITTVGDAGKEEYKLQKEALEEQQNEAKENKDWETYNNIKSQLAELDKNSRESGEIWSNVGNVESKVDESDVALSLEQFAEKDYNSEINTIYSELEKLLANVKAVRIPGNLADGKMESAGKLFYTFSLPVSREQIEELLENWRSSIVASAIFSQIKAVLGFIQAMIKLVTDIGYDHDLNSVIDSGKYSEIGGLPGGRSQDSYASKFAVEDSQKSQDCKELLEIYSAENGSGIPESTKEIYESGFLNEISTIQTAMDTEWTVWNFIDKIGTILTAAWNILKGIISCGWFELINSDVYGKLILVGYLGYNTANRTTYTKSALTGASYASSLPSVSNQDADGYALYGAETEYIIYGSLSEKSNQTDAFWSIFSMRLLYDMFLVFSNGEVNAIGAAYLAVPLIGPVLYVILLVVWTAAEAFLDTIILCNGGEIEILKTTLYLSIAGIPTLVKKLSGITLPASAQGTMKNAIANGLESVYKENEGTKVGENIGAELDNIKWGAKGVDGKSDVLSSGIDFFTFDYTKCLMLYMLLKPTDTLLLRLSNIIQMEASWNEYHKYFTTSFDLGKSYTYLRASGSFTGSQFLKIADSDPTSNERIIYRGY